LGRELEEQLVNVELLKSKSIVFAKNEISFAGSIESIGFSSLSI
jgi:hypothetical protein